MHPASQDALRIPQGRRMRTVRRDAGVEVSVREGTSAARAWVLHVRDAAGVSVGDGQSCGPLL